jgi:hypothetical protein
LGNILNQVTGIHLLKRLDQENKQNEKDQDDDIENIGSIADDGATFPPFRTHFLSPTSE